MKPNFSLFVILSILSGLHCAHAQELSTFNGNVLTIPSVESNGVPGAFQDVQIQINEDGELLLLDVETGFRIQAINNVELIVTRTVPVQAFLRISGILNGVSVGGLGTCQQAVEDIGVTLLDNTFNVVVYVGYENSQLLPLGSFACTAGIVGFDVTAPLPVFGLSPGEYFYNVHDEFTGAFTLEADNNL